MGRPHRIDPEDGWHHVMNRGVDRSAIFFEDVDRIEFGRLLGVVCERFDVEIHAYCLMGNHYHLLVRCPEAGISDAMHLLGTLFARFVNDRLGRDGPLFKSRFTSRLITTEQYLVNVVRYVHRNALDVAGVEHPREYRWSSHRAHLGVRIGPPWLSSDLIQSWFGSDLQAFDDFVAGDLESVRAMDGGRRLAAVATSREIREACNMVVAERAGGPLTSRRSRVKALSLSVAEEAHDELASAVYADYDLDGGSLRSARSRARKMRSDPGFEGLVDAVWSLLAA